MKRRLPIGIQDFPKIRENGFVYVDKTARIHDLITGSGGAFFLSRPRRFGKSVLCSTLKAVFEGRRELFGEIAGEKSIPKRSALAINSLEWEWKKHPVIRLDLNPGDYAGYGLETLNSVLSRQLRMEAEKFGVTLVDKDCTNQFASLIALACKKAGEKTVVIIDEYDKPLLETMTDNEKHTAIRGYLKGFYGVLKPSDEYLRFVFLTGVTKFSHVSIFSDLNHLSDMTLNPRYADICGLTEDEVEQNFEPEIAAIIEETGREREEYLERMRRYYNGYRFSKDPLKVYNPFGLLKHFNESGDFQAYWYETGTPTFLINLITKQKINIAGLSNMKVRYEDFRKYDIETMKAETVLYQSGYLTITGYEEEVNEYSLDYPNDEVRSSFARSLMDKYFESSSENPDALSAQLLKAMLNGDIEEAINALRQFLAAVPYDIIKETENYYETAVHLIFSMLGFNCRSEVRIAAGRIDTLVETKKFVYCFEFKIDKTADEALAQIDTKEYLLPWEAKTGKKLFKVGVNFDSKKRNIETWKYSEQ
jgi:hypothetical protein